MHAWQYISNTVHEFCTQIESVNLLIIFQNLVFCVRSMCCMYFYTNVIQYFYQQLFEFQGRIQDLIRGGGQIVTGLKLPFWGLSFVEFWCWGLLFGGRGGGPGPPGPPPWIRPWSLDLLIYYLNNATMCKPFHA